MFFVNGFQVEFYEGKDYGERSLFDDANQYRTALRHAAAPKTMHRMQFRERKRWARERMRAERELVNILQPLVTDASAYRAVRNQTDSWLERWATRAYESGMAAAGIGDLPLGGGDDHWLRKHYLTDERRYMRAFLDGLRAKKVSLAMMRYRARLYSQSLDTAFYVGLAASFPQTRATKIHWVLGIAEHCAGCVRLSRRVWTPMSLPTTPRAGATPCKANCKCSLEVHYDATVKLAAAPTPGRGKVVTSEGVEENIRIESDDPLLRACGIEPDSPLGVLVLASG